MAPRGFASRSMAAPVTAPLSPITQRPRRAQRCAARRRSATHRFALLGPARRGVAWHGTVMTHRTDQRSACLGYAWHGTASSRSVAVRAALRPAWLCAAQHGMASRGTAPLLPIDSTRRSATLRWARSRLAPCRAAWLRGAPHRTDTTHRTLLGWVRSRRARHCTVTHRYHAGLGFAPHGRATHRGVSLRIASQLGFAAHSRASQPTAPLYPLDSVSRRRARHSYAAHRRSPYCGVPLRSVWRGSVRHRWFRCVSCRVVPHRI